MQSDWLKNGATTLPIVGDDALFRTMWMGEGVKVKKRA